MNFVSSAPVLGTSSGFVNVSPTGSIGGGQVSFSNDSYVSKDVSPVGAKRVTEMGWWCDYDTSEIEFEVGLYAADGGVVPGEAGTLLYSINATKTTGVGWKKVTGLDWAISPGIDYWLGYQIDTGSSITLFSSADGLGIDGVGGTISLPNPFGGGVLGDVDGLYSIYALYEVGGPNVTINTPLNQSYTTTSITFNLTSTDAFNCSYTLDNGVTNFTMANLSTSPTYWTATNSTMAQGNQNVTFYCFDTSANINNSESVEFYIKYVPDVTINTPLNQSYTTTSITFNLTSTDAFNCSYTLDNGVTNFTMANLSTSPTYWTATNSTMAQGNQNVTFYCFDTSANINNSESVEFYIDSINPDISITYPSNGSNFITSDVNVNYSASDSAVLSNCWWTNDSNTNVSLANCSTNITGFTWEEGIHNITIWANDSAGNENSSSVTFNVNTTLPGNPLIIGNTTTILGGSHSFGYVLIYSNATLTIDDSVGWLNLTASENITIYGNISGIGKSVYSGGTYSSCGPGTDGDGDNGGKSGTNSGCGASGYGGGGGGAGYNSNGGNGGSGGDTSLGGDGGSSPSLNLSQRDLNISMDIASSGGAGASPISGTNGPDGGRGGAGIRFRSEQIIITGKIDFAGDNGNAQDSFNDIGGGGGGAGGTIILDANRINISNSIINVNGGNGASCKNDVASDCGGGGGGSGGVFKVFYGSIFDNNSLSLDISGGSAGSGSGAGSNGVEGGLGNTSYEQIENLSVTLLSPSNDSSSSPTKNFFCSANLTTEINGNLTNVTLHIWNSTGTLNKTITNVVTGTSNYTNFTHTFSEDDAYLWNCLTESDTGFKKYAIGNYTLNVFSSVPSVNLNTPQDNQFFNFTFNNINFSYTPEYADGIDSCELYGNWTGVWHLNQTDASPDNATLNNFSILTLKDGFYIWNVRCNNSLGNYNWDINNRTVKIDTLLPTISNILITTTQGSQTISFDFNASDMNLEDCWYNIFDSDGKNITINTSVTCNSAGNPDTVPDYATYNLTIYANDSAGNINSSTQSFTTTAGGSSSSGGGGGGTPTNVIKVIAIIKPNESEILVSNLQRAILFARINEICLDKEYLKCSITTDGKNSLITTLKDQTIEDLTLEELDLWIDYYNRNKFDEVEVNLKDETTYNLYSGVIVRESEFRITPSAVTGFCLITSSNSSCNFLIQSDENLANVSIILGDVGLSVSKDTTTATIIFTPPVFPLPYSAKVIEGSVSYTSEKGKNAFQQIGIRVINLRSLTIWVWAGVLVVGSVFGIFKRKEISKWSKKLWKKISK